MQVDGKGDTPVHPAATPFHHKGEAGGLGVVMIHGLTASPTEVMPMAHHLRDRRPEVTIACPLLPGHGTSLEDLRRTNRTAWTDAVAREVEALGRTCRTIAAVGVSMGAVLAAEVAMTDDRVESAALLAPVFELKRSSTMLLPVARWFMRYRKKSRQSLENHKNKGLFSYPCYPLDSLIAFSQLARQTKARLQHLTIPVLIAAGHKDRYISRSSVANLHSMIASSRIETVDCPQSGHVLPHEPDAPRLFDALSRFLTDVHDLEERAAAPSSHVA